jgi:hypothetical protein
MTKKENPRKIEYRPQDPWFFAQDVLEVARNWDKPVDEFYEALINACKSMLQRQRGRAPDIEGAAKTAADYKASGATSFHQYGKLKHGDDHDGREAARKKASRAVRKVDKK